MSRTYTPEEKAAALARLDANGGKVILTCLQTGIPVRTLERWKALRNAPPPPPPPPQQFSVPPPPPPSDVGTALLPSEQLPAAPDDSAAALDADYDALRQRLYHEALTIAASLSDGLRNAPLNQRAIALSRIVDRLLKLDTQSPSSHEVPPLPQLNIPLLEEEGEGIVGIYWRQPGGQPHGPYPVGEIPRDVLWQLQRAGDLVVHLSWLDENQAEEN